MLIPHRVQFGLFSPCHPCSHPWSPGQPPNRSLGLLQCPCWIHPPVTLKWSPAPNPSGAPMSRVQSRPFSVTYKGDPGDRHVHPSAHPMLCYSYSQTPGCLRAFARATFAHLEYLFAWTIRSPTCFMFSLNVTSLGRPSLIPSLGQGPAVCSPDIPELVRFPQKQSLRLAYL